MGGTGPKRTPRPAARFAGEFNVSFRPLAEAVERLGQWAAAGAGAVYLQLLDLADLDQVELLGEEVLAQLS